MSKQEWIEALIFSGLRLIAVVCLLTGLLNLLLALIDSWHRFDPNYLGSFLSATALRPALLVASGAILYPVAGPWSRCMAKATAAGRP